MLLISAFLTNANIAYIENFISNPSFEKSNRKEATQLLLNHTFKYVKNKGYNYVVGFSLYEKLANRFVSMGFDKSIKNVFVLGKEV